MDLRRADRSAGRLLRGGGTAIIVALACSVVAAQLTDPVEIMRRSVAARGNVDYSGIRTVVMFEGGVKVRGVEQEVHCQAPDKLRIMVIAPESERGKLWLVDGQVQWECDPHAHRALRMQLPPPRQVRLQRLREMERLARTMRLQYCGTESIAGRPAHVIKVYTDEGLPVKKTWIDVETFVTLKTLRFDSQGRVKSSAYFTRIDFNPEFGPGLFTFSPPAGYTVIEAERPPQRMPLAAAEQRVGFRAVLPSYLPAGYHFLADRVAVIELRGRRALWMSFSNGVDTFSLFQRRGDGPTDARRCGRAITWEDGNFCFTLLGTLSAEEMQRVRASIRP